MENYICGGSKYIYQRGYIYLPINLDVSTLPKQVLVEGENLSLKSSFHTSLVCVKDILAQNSIEGLEQKIIDLFCKFVSENEVSFAGFKNEFRFAQLDERKSVVALCSVSNLEIFFKTLNLDLHMQVPLQPTHVTLYTLQPDAGIGLNNDQELRERSHVIQVQKEIKVGLQIS